MSNERSEAKRPADERGSPVTFRTSSGAPPTNLPAQFDVEPQILGADLAGSSNESIYNGISGWSLSPLIGREHELQLIAQRLQDPACRLLTITGVGGVGKSHLALAAAKHLLAAPAGAQLFPDGVYFVNLTAAMNGAQLLSSVAQVFQFQFEPAGDPLVQLVNYLRSRRLLLILDNIEQLANDSPRFTTLLVGAPGLKLLATSRQRLNLAGEWLLPVEGLPVEPVADVQTAAPASPATVPPAIALFIRTAQAVQPTFSPEDEAATVAQICRQLAGLPLGIQLAAGALRSYTCSEIVAGLQESSDLIAAQLRDIPPRHRTLRAVFLHSWGLLAPEEQHLFQQLAVFAGSFSATAVSAVTGAHPTLVDALVDKSLLQRLLTRIASPAPVYRLRMHPVLRQFAEEQLAANPALQTLLRERHALYYSRLLQEHGQQLNGPYGTQARQILRAEQDNIHASWQWASFQPALAILEQSVPSYTAFYLLQDPLADLADRLDKALSHVEPLTHAAEPQVTLARTVMALLLNAMAQVQNEQGNYLLAIKTAQRAASAAQENRRGDIEGWAYLQWGRAHFFRGQYDDAHQRLSMALTIAHSAASKPLLAAAYHALGTNRLYRGDYAAGQDHYDEALRLYSELGDEAKTLQVRYNIALVLFYSGAYLAAGAVFSDCLQTYRNRGDLRAAGLLLNNLGAVYAQLGDYTQATAYYEEALALRRSLGDRPYESLILANLGLVAANRQDFQRAANHCRAALAISQELGERATTAYAQTCLGYAVAGLGWQAEAVELFKQAIQLRKTLGQSDQMLEPLAGLAAVYLNQDQPRQALTFVEQILPQLKRLTMAAIVDPMRILWICYQVLATNHDLRATDVLTTAFAAIESRAAKIPDERLRKYYCENVVIHRQILNAHASVPGERHTERADQWRTRIEEHASLAEDLERLLQKDEEQSETSDE